MREALQAGVFGTQTAFDLYTISYNYTIYIFTTVAYALCIAAVPVISGGTSPRTGTRPLPWPGT